MFIPDLKTLNLSTMALDGTPTSASDLKVLATSWHFTSPPTLRETLDTSAKIVDVLLARNIDRVVLPEDMPPYISMYVALSLTKKGVDVYFPFEGSKDVIPVLNYPGDYVY